MLLGLAGFMTAGLFGFFDGTALENTAPVAALAILVGYLLVVLAPCVGLAPTLLSATYPADPADALCDTPASALRYSTADELTGGPAMEALRRTLLDSPSSIRPEERSALWILAARDEYYASALSATRRLAQLRFQETVRARAREFSIEMQVALDDLESASVVVPPTSAW